jgi:hypothetical protein
VDIRRLVTVAALAAAPFLLCACGNRYDAYRGDGYRLSEEEIREGRRIESGEDYDFEKRRGSPRPGSWSVIEAGEFQGGSGPGSYGGSYGSVIEGDGDGVRGSGSGGRR